MLKSVCSRAIIGLLYLLSLLPLEVLYCLALCLFVLLYYVTGYRRSVVDENLRKSFPEKAEEELKEIAKKYYRYLADLVVETIKTISIPKHEIIKRVEGINIDLVNEALDGGRSVIGILGHYGNWEMCAQRFSLLFDKTRIIVYKPLNNPQFDKMMLKVRSRFGANLVNTKTIARHLIKHRNEPTITVMVGDQTPALSELQYFTNFLNQPTGVYLGVEKLAKMTNSSVFFCDIRLVKKGYYSCTFVPLFNESALTAPHEITNTHIGYLENVIKHQPEYWLWSHRRWKHKPEDVVKYAG